MTDQALYEAMAEEEGLFGFKVRSPYDGEAKYFEEHPEVSGMAAEDDAIVLNPFVGPDIDLQSVKKNEAFRLLLRKSGVVPEFELTAEQGEGFIGSPYEDDPESSRATIAGRIYSGDPSAKATDEQRKWVDQFLLGL
jgi:hypothetical protein|tara:strand:- start:294 stop:704 length:411 start_codon:yes stop_codon:yes gene_type:complete